MQGALRQRILLISFRVEAFAIALSGEHNRGISDKHWDWKEIKCNSEDDERYNDDNCDIKVMTTASTNIKSR